jgi:hypothetical protein
LFFFKKKKKLISVIPDKGIAVQDQSRQKVGETLSQKTSQGWWYISVIPRTQETEVKGSWSKASIEKK